jgi:hypothetical protein
MLLAYFDLNAPTRVVRLVIATALGGTLLGWQSVARADTQGCIEQHSKGQEQRDQGALVEARAAFVACAQEECPQAVREQCMTLLEQVNTALPSIIVAALDNQGRDTTQVRLKVDDVEVSPSLLTSAIPMNPGRRRLQFISPTGKQRKVMLILREGEHSRRVAVDFRPGPQLRNDPIKTLVPAPEKGYRSWLPWALAGVGAAAMGSFTYFALTGRSRQGDLERTCSPHCTSEQTNSLGRAYLAADISLGVGVAAIAGGLVVWLWDKPSAPISVGRTGWLLSPQKNGISIGYKGKF